MVDREDAADDGDNLLLYRTIDGRRYCWRYNSKNIGGWKLRVRFSFLLSAALPRSQCS